MHHQEMIFRPFRVSSSSEEQRRRRPRRVSKNMHETTSSTETFNPPLAEVFLPPAEDSRIYRVKLPDDAVPGQVLQVYANNRAIRVLVCPDTFRRGGTLRVTVPKPPPDTPGIRRVAYSGDAGPAVYSVPIPAGVRRCQSFCVYIQGRHIKLVRPMFSFQGGSLRVVPPPLRVYADSPNVEKVVHADSRAVVPGRVGGEFR